MKEGYVTIHEYEERIYRVEGFRVFLRPYHPTGGRQLVSAIRVYDWDNAAPGSWTVAEYISKRLLNEVKRNRWVVKIIGQHGRLPRRNTKLETLRAANR